MSRVVPTTMPTIPYTARDFATIQRELIRYILATRPDAINAFQEGDVAKILLELLAYVGDTLSYSIDRVGEEAFITTLRTRAAALRHAAGLAYPVSTATAASVILTPEKFSDIPPQITASASVNETQVVTITGVPLAGTFVLSLDGEPTLPLAYNASAAQVQTALENTVVVGTGNVRVTGNAGGPYTVTFISALAYTNVSTLTVNVTALTRNEVQKLTLSVGATGTFKIVFNIPGGGSETTGNIAVAATAANVLTALESLTAIVPGDVSVTGNTGGPWTVTFLQAYKNTDVPTMTSDTTSLVGSLTITTLTEGSPITGLVSATNGANNTYDVTFAKGTVLNAAGFVWEVAEDTKIVGLSVNADTFQDVFNVPVVQGVSFFEAFSSTGRRFQSYSTQASTVIQDSLIVRVGSVSADPWTKVDVLALAGPGEEVYTVRYTDTGNAIIQFGDDVTGAAPSDSTPIYVNGRTGGGVVTNVAALSMQADITGVTDKIGFPSGTASVSFTNLVAASGGADQESVAEIQRNIPAWIRTVDKAITKEDYDTLAGAFESSNGTISRAVSYLASASIMFQTGGPTITHGNPLVVPKDTVLTLADRTFKLSRDFHVVETDPILFLNPNLVYVYAWSRGDRGFIAATSVLMQDVRAYLQDRSVVTVTIVVLPGKQKVININLGEVVYFSNYSKTAVESAIIKATADFFLSDNIQPGQPFRLSDYYAVIEAIAGVDHFVDQTPASDVSVEKDEIPYPGTLSYTLTPTSLPLDEDENRAAWDNRLYS